MLVLKGNFIEDIKNVSVLLNLCELDLSDNCLLEQSVLSPLSCLAALKWLNIENNPLSYHPHHRIYTASCLHINTVTVKFVLDRSLLTKSEQKLVGTIHSTQHPYPSRTQPSFESISSESTPLEVDERRVRNAMITDASVEVHENPISTHSLTTSIEHLETKRQIKEYREKHGASWLQQQAGSIIQDVLGFEKTPLPVTSSPYETDFLLHAKEVKDHFNGTESATENAAQVSPDSAASDTSLYAAEDEKESSTDEEIDLGDGDESLFLCKNKENSEEIFLVVTKLKLSEREVTTSKEITHWHVHSLTKCERIEDESPYIQLEFDALRRDRKVRQYTLDEDEMERLVEVLQKIIEEKPVDLKYVKKYQCMKCSLKFKKDYYSGKYIGEEQMECPACESTLVIEDD